MQQLLLCVSWMDTDTLNLGVIPASQHEFTALNHTLISHQQLGADKVPEVMHDVINMHY